MNVKKAGMQTKNLGRIMAIGIVLSAWVFTAYAGTVNTCAQYYTLSTASTPSYNVETNYWNMGTCPTTQCMTIDTVTGDFGVTSGTFNCGQNVATYPSIYYGCHFGTCSPGTNLPLPVSMLQCVTSSWTLGVTNQTGGDLWDAAYDIWFSPNSNTSSHSAELMIWLSYPPGTGVGGCYKSTVMIDGYQWNVYEGSSVTFNPCPPPTCGGPPWNYIAYLATSPITVFNNTDILAFINDSVSRCFIQPSWYLDDIEAGNELRTGGVPFYSSGFNANVCEMPTATPTSTATLTPTACGLPGNTCTPTNTPTNTVTATPTNTPTPTPILSNNYVTYPNPWPDPQNPSSGVSFGYQNDQAADQVQLKIYTVAYRKIYEDDGLPTSQGTQRYGVDFSATNLNLANGLYYFVVVWNRGGQLSQKVMKVLIQR